MPQTKHQRIAADRVAAWLAQNELSITWLAETAGADPGTVGDFLNGSRWPKVGTQGRFEKALGWPAGSIRQIGQGRELDLPSSVPSVGGSEQDPSHYVESPGDRAAKGMSDDDVLRRLEQMQEDIRAMSEWVAQRRESST